MSASAIMMSLTWVLSSVAATSSLIIPESTKTMPVDSSVSALPSSS